MTPSHRVRRRNFYPTKPPDTPKITEEILELCELFGSPGWQRALTIVASHVGMLRAQIFERAWDEDRTLDAVFELRALRRLFESLYLQANKDVPDNVRELFG
jgi:hypothetical protein